ncbi:SDR family oxidoreductase [bacterium]|jgi:NAD(P)-dependent dehydrogenase (short-subunit alcohol dehydrogenase family)|nr:SDR family oxidoreductase [bacterium]MBT6832003.1 SDR family oxidoreductase [bacterium]MBT6996713.1 SDR family oxidoreductase [bacterium]MBT7772681.1 SDR family oxidoreductase [bacterium]
MKTVLITGASRGIGRAAVEKFLENEWRVIGVARNFENKIEHPNFMAEIFDLSETEKISAFVEKIGAIDVLVNNAGVMNAECDFEIAVNLVAPVELARSFSQKMPAGSRIVSVASVAAETGHPDIWYGATKAAIVNATKSLAIEFSSRIICTTLCPGPVETAMLAQIPAERVQMLCQKLPNGRPAFPAEVADSIYFLATKISPEKNGEHFSVGCEKTES